MTERNKSRQQKAKPKPKNNNASIVQVSSQGNYGSIVRNTPHIFSSGAKSLVIRHREFMGALNSQGSTTSVNLSYWPLNPGDHTTFPWLSSIARNFSMYKFRKASLIYVSEAATSTAGCIMVAYCPDATRAVSNTPKTKTDLLELDCALRAAPWESCSVDCTLLNVKKFVFPGNNYNPTSLAGGVFSDVNYGGLPDMRDVCDGVIFSGTTGTPAGVLGDIYLDYEVELFDPTAAAPVVSGNAACGGNATGFFTLNYASINPASQMQIIFQTNSVTWTAYGTFLVTVRNTSTLGFAKPTWTTSSGVTQVLKQITTWASTTTYCDNLGYMGQFVLVCNGQCSLTHGTMSGLDASSTTYVVITPIPVQFGTSVFA